MHCNFVATAKPEHYTCMIDLVGRAGRLDEAVKNLTKEMSFEPDTNVDWILQSAATTDI